MIIATPQVHFKKSVRGERLLRGIIIFVNTGGNKGISRDEILIFLLSFLLHRNERLQLGSNAGSHRR